jgi:phosphatidylserine decarboxylase
MEMVKNILIISNDWCSCFIRLLHENFPITEVNTLFQTIYRFMIELTNGRWSSSLLKRFATSNMSRYVVPHFSRIYQIDTEEMEGDLKEFSTLHDFFIRKLRKGSRPINQDAQAVTSPVDAVLEEVGPISEQKLIEVKGKTYSIEEMLGNDALLQKYINGTFMVLYLSPSHYHRIHSPITGRVTASWTLGKKSYPVNSLGLKYGKSTLSKNYRTVTEIKHQTGHIAVVKVGAMFVNSIEVTHENEHVEKGQELAYFTFGSTVVLLFEKDSIQSTLEKSLPFPIKVGERIALLKET